MNDPEPHDGNYFTYGAFISYRHVDPDRRWAVWLHTSLESYRLPKRIALAAGRSRAVRRAFRDEDELAATADLSEKIRLALEGSRFLIVVCSPRAVESRWVNSEVKYFRQLGRGDRILALLIEGEPSGSFPPALIQLREGASADAAAAFGITQPLAADVQPRFGESRSEAKHVALLRLISTLVGCDYDSLRQRHLKRRQAQLITGLVASLVLVGLMAVLAVSAVVQRNRAAEQEKIATREKDSAVRRLAGIYRTEALQALDPLESTAWGMLADEQLRELKDRGASSLVTSLAMANYDAPADVLAHPGAPGHWSWVSKDARHAITGAASGELAVWDVPSRKVLRKHLFKNLAGRRMEDMFLQGYGLKAFPGETRVLIFAPSGEGKTGHILNLETGLIENSLFPADDRNGGRLRFELSEPPVGPYSGIGLLLAAMDGNVSLIAPDGVRERWEVPGKNLATEGKVLWHHEHPSATWVDYESRIRDGRSEGFIFFLGPGSSVGEKVPFSHEGDAIAATPERVFVQHGADLESYSSVTGALVESRPLASGTFDAIRFAGQMGGTLLFKIERGQSFTLVRIGMKTGGAADVVAPDCRAIVIRSQELITLEEAVPVRYAGQDEKFVLRRRVPPLFGISAEEPVINGISVASGGWKIDLFPSRDTSRVSIVDPVTLKETACFSLGAAGAERARPDVVALGEGAAVVARDGLLRSYPVPRASSGVLAVFETAMPRVFDISSSLDGRIAVLSGDGGSPLERYAVDLLDLTSGKKSGSAACPAIGMLLPGVSLGPRVRVDGPPFILRCAEKDLDRGFENPAASGLVPIAAAADESWELSAAHHPETDRTDVTLIRKNAPPVSVDLAGRYLSGDVRGDRCVLLGEYARKDSYSDRTMIRILDLRAGTEIGEIPVGAGRTIVNGAALAIRFVDDTHVTVRNGNYRRPYTLYDLEQPDGSGLMVGAPAGNPILGGTLFPFWNEDTRQLVGYDLASHQVRWAIPVESLVATAADAPVALVIRKRAGSYRGELRAVDLETGQLRSAAIPFDGLGGSPGSVIGIAAISANGRRIATRDYRGTVRFFDDGGHLLGSFTVNDLWPEREILGLKFLDPLDAVAIGTDGGHVAVFTWKDHGDPALVRKAATRLDIDRNGSLVPLGEAAYVEAIRRLRDRLAKTVDSR